MIETLAICQLLKIIQRKTNGKIHLPWETIDFENVSAMRWNQCFVVSILRISWNCKSLVHHHQSSSIIWCESLPLSKSQSHLTLPLWICFPFAHPFAESLNLIYSTTQVETLLSTTHPRKVFLTTFVVFSLKVERHKQPRCIYGFVNLDLGIALTTNKCLCFLCIKKGSFLLILRFPLESLNYHLLGPLNFSFILYLIGLWGFPFIFYSRR